MAIDLTNPAGSLGNLSGSITKFLFTPLVWFGIIIFVLVGLVMILVLKKRRNLRFPCHEVTAFGINTFKVGWFGIDWKLGGLYTRGRKVLRTKEGEIIANFHETDFVEINGTRGVIVYRDPQSKLLYPLQFTQFQPNKGEFDKIKTKVPPREFVDTAIDIIRETTTETQDRLQKILQFAGWALVVIASLVAIIVVTQMVKTGQQEASELIVKAGETCLSNARDICNQLINDRVSTSAP